jgi:hypothetical protein
MPLNQPAERHDGFVLRLRRVRGAVRQEVLGQLCDPRP